jgi:hypothetical protein
MIVFDCKGSKSIYHTITNTTTLKEVTENTIWTILVSALQSNVAVFFGHFDSAGYTQYKYIVGKLDLFALAAKQAMKFAMVSFSTYF